ncbi:MAG: hypothetical protein SVS85_01315, partial [Candidatus Nanohaloarchaea archaeon]|nr:hypothetical protein [Candidatus Nanohaloarchaea archaeon]
MSGAVSPQTFEFEGFDDEPELGGSSELEEVVETHLDRSEGVEGVLLENSRHMGSYAGRKDSRVALGMNDEALDSPELDDEAVQFILGHELGHDFYDQHFHSTDYRGDMGLIEQREREARDLIDLTLSEAVAELSAYHLTGVERPEFLDRNPFHEEFRGEYASSPAELEEDRQIAVKLKEFRDRLRRINRDNSGALLDLYDDIDAPNLRREAWEHSHSHSMDTAPEKFSQPELDEFGITVSYNFNDKIQHEYWTDLLKQVHVVHHRDIDESLFLTRYWAEAETSDVSGPRKELQYQVIDSYLPDTGEQHRDMDR